MLGSNVIGDSSVRRPSRDEPSLLSMSSSTTSTSSSNSTAPAPFPSLHVTTKGLDRNLDPVHISPVVGSSSSSPHAAPGAGRKTQTHQQAPAVPSTIPNATKFSGRSVSHNSNTSHNLHPHSHASTVSVATNTTPSSGQHTLLEDSLDAAAASAAQSNVSSSSKQAPSSSSSSTGSLFSVAPTTRIINDDSSSSRHNQAPSSVFDDPDEVDEDDLLLLSMSSSLDIKSPPNPSNNPSSEGFLAAAASNASTHHSSNNSNHLSKSNSRTDLPPPGFTVAHNRYSANNSNAGSRPGERINPSESAQRSSTTSSTGSMSFLSSSSPPNFLVDQLNREYSNSLSSNGGHQMNNTNNVLTGHSSSITMNRNESPNPPTHSHHHTTTHPHTHNPDFDDDNSTTGGVADDETASNRAWEQANRHLQQQQRQMMGMHSSSSSNTTTTGTTGQDSLPNSAKKSTGKGLFSFAHTPFSAFSSPPLTGSSPTSAQTTGLRSDRDRAPLPAVPLFSQTTGGTATPAINNIVTEPHSPASYQPNLAAPSTHHNPYHPNPSLHLFGPTSSAPVSAGASPRFRDQYRSLRDAFNQHDMDNNYNNNNSNNNNNNNPNSHRDRDLPPVPHSSTNRDMYGYGTSNPMSDRYHTNFGSYTPGSATRPLQPNNQQSHSSQLLLQQQQHMLQQALLLQQQSRLQQQQREREQQRDRERAAAVAAVAAASISDDGTYPNTTNPSNLTGIHTPSRRTSASQIFAAQQAAALTTSAAVAQIALQVANHTAAHLALKQQVHTNVVGSSGTHTPSHQDGSSTPVTAVSISPSLHAVNSNSSNQPPTLPALPPANNNAVSAIPVPAPIPPSSNSTASTSASSSSSSSTTTTSSSSSSSSSTTTAPTTSTSPSVLPSSGAAGSPSPNPPLPANANTNSPGPAAATATPSTPSTAGTTTATASTPSNAASTSTPSGASTSPPVPAVAISTPTGETLSNPAFTHPYFLKQAQIQQLNASLGLNPLAAQLALAANNPFAAAAAAQAQLNAAAAVAMANSSSGSSTPPNLLAAQFAAQQQQQQAAALALAANAAAAAASVPGSNSNGATVVPNVNPLNPFGNSVNTMQAIANAQFFALQRKHLQNLNRHRRR